MKKSLKFVEQYLSDLDQDMAEMATEKDCNNSKERKEILYFLEQTEMNLFFILESVKNTIAKFKQHH